MLFIGKVRFYLINSYNQCSFNYHNKLSWGVSTSHIVYFFFTDGEETEIQFAESVLTPAADTYYKKHSINFNSPQEDFFYNWQDDRYLQFLIGLDSDTSDVLRELIGLDDVVPLLIGVDIPNRKFAIMEYGIEITIRSVSEFVEKFENGELKFRDINNRLTGGEIV